MLLPVQTIYDKNDAPYKNPYDKPEEKKKEKNETPEFEKLYADPMVMVDKYSQKKLTYASLISPEIFRLSSVWPFELMPDELIIQEKRIIIKQKQFPYFISTSSIPIGSLSVFQVDKSLFFSSLYIKGGNTEHTISWLRHDDARLAKEIIDGLRMKQNESIKITQGSDEEKIHALQILGSIS